LNGLKIAEEEKGVKVEGGRRLLDASTNFALHEWTVGRNCIDGFLLSGKFTCHAITKS
jgi:hypothetical protein